MDNSRQFFFLSESFLKRFLKSLFLISIISVLVYPQSLDIEKLSGLKPRSIGPAGMSGRVTAIDVVLSSPNIIYVGSASGGLWKSTSGGTNWKPIFDDQPVASIGAVAINQRIPDIVWVGTGEGNPRNSQTSGNGVYKSLDAGKTWIHLGLDNTRNINRLILDPYNSDVAYVAALGSAWGESKDRGVYKTTDGGKTWEKVLYVNETTGASDLVMDPSNPNKLIVSMWQYRRWPWFFKSGGPGSGIYITIDAGKTWKKITSEDGIPKGELGRIGLAISKSSPNVVYALIESKKTALYRSDDGGYNWKMTTNKGVNDRPFYYSDLYVDPSNENRVYYVHSEVSISEDGGKNFSTLINYRHVHSDHHAWWIDPNDPNFIIDGNDGGMAISRDKAKTWRFVENLPLAQFYHVDVDNGDPYYVYGGMQDNGSWRGPNRVLVRDGIYDSYWQMLTFGDGFDVVPDKSNSRYAYSMSQGGYLMRVDMKTGYQKYIQPVQPNGVRLRFNWNAGIAADPLNPDVIYFGSQFVHKTTDYGDSWQTISPDLTTNNPEYQKQLQSGGLTLDVTEAENYTTIMTIDPSPVKEGVIWVGTDDGNVQVTKDGGKTWENVVGNINGVPKGTWVPQVRASYFNSGEAFVVFDNHRRDDWTPYVYHTTDYGESWESLIGKNKIWGYALSILQDPVEPNLIFLGTEFGLYVSIDHGKTWTKWKDKENSYPTVSTMDMQIQKRTNDLVVGTFGRAIYIFDDITPLREIAHDRAKILNDHLKIFKVPDAVEEIYKSPKGVLYPADADFKGENRPYGAMISFVANPDTSEKNHEKNKSDNEEEDSIKSNKDNYDSVKVEILNSNGEVIRTLKDSVKAGINRIYWRLDKKGVRFPSHEKPKPGSPERGGVEVVPGTYKIRITYGKYSDSTSVNVSFDPRMTGITQTDLQQRMKAIDEFEKKIEVGTEAADKLRDAEKTIKLVDDALKEREDDQANQVKKAGKAVNDSIKTIMDKINQKEVQGLVENPDLLISKLSNAYDYLTSSWKVPGENTKLAIKLAENNLQKVVDDVNNFFETEWKGYREKVKNANIRFFESYEPIKIK